jgi:hypothetical protein
MPPLRGPAQTPAEGVASEPRYEGFVKLMMSPAPVGQS